MKTIIAGSREGATLKDVEAAMKLISWTPSIILSGTARGVDQLGETWATLNSLPIEQYPANWNFHGKSAGYIRNKLMASNADALVALWDGSSRGTSHMINLARTENLLVYVHLI